MISFHPLDEQSTDPEFPGRMLKDVDLVDLAPLFFGFKGDEWSYPGMPIGEKVSGALTIQELTNPKI